MLLRWLVTNYVQQAARQQLEGMVVDALGNRAGPGPAGQPVASDGQAAPASEPPPCDVACLFALGVEAGGLVDLLQGYFAARCPNYKFHQGQLASRQVLVAQTGVGQEAAARATAELIELHHPAWVVSTGFAGGLVPDFGRGHLLMADSVVDQNDRQWDVGLKVPADQLPRAVHVGRLLTVDHLVRSSDEKRTLAERHHAVACDMETAAVAEACRQAKVRFLAVRIISDSLDDNLPPEVEKLLDQKNLASKLGAATAAIWNRPSTVKDLWRLQEEALKASDRLARFLVGVIEQLDVARERAPAE
ncbi:MAG: hypothetical protein J5I93_28940 [Pirellulaceae bacterium]|nr:hypothetical protein [Pirellulaceae bacterium]